MPKPPSNKILIMLPFWSGDRGQCLELARLLADMQPAHSDNADILFVARFDTKHDQGMIAHVKRKFDVFVHTTKRIATGWPMGCNGLFYSTIEYAFGMTATGRIPNYKAFFNCAADTCPLSRDSIEHLHQEFGRIQPATIAGAMVTHGGREHINGDAALIVNSPDFLENLVRQMSSIKLTAGWDWALNEEFRRTGWANMPGVKSRWQTPSLTFPEVAMEQGLGIRWLHGVKDLSCISAARKLLL